MSPYRFIQRGLAALSAPLANDSQTKESLEGWAVTRTPTFITRPISCVGWDVDLYYRVFKLVDTELV